MYQLGSCKISGCHLKLEKPGIFRILFGSRTPQTNIRNYQVETEAKNNNDIKSLVFNKLCEIEIFQR